MPFSTSFTSSVRSGKLCWWPVYIDHQHHCWSVDHGLGSIIYIKYNYKAVIEFIQCRHSNCFERLYAFLSRKKGKKAVTKHRKNTLHRMSIRIIVVHARRTKVWGFFGSSWGGRKPIIQISEGGQVFPARTKKTSPKLEERATLWFVSLSVGFYSCLSSQFNQSSVKYSTLKTKNEKCKQRKWMRWESIHSRRYTVLVGSHFMCYGYES